MKFLKFESLLAAALMASAVASNAATVMVGPSQGATLDTIAEGIAAANSGDTVSIVDAGTYAGFTIPGGKVLTIERSNLLAADSVTVDGAVSTDAAATAAIDVTLGGINFYRSTAGNPVTIEQYATPTVTVAITFTNCKFTETGGECIRIDGANPGTAASAVTVNVTNSTLTATNANRSAIRLSSTAGGVGGTGNSNFVTVNVTNSTLSSSVYRPIMNSGGTNQVFNITNTSITSGNERAISDEASVGSIYNITGSTLIGGASAIRTVGGPAIGISQTWNIQRSTLKGTTGRVIDIGTTGVPGSPNTVNLYNSILIGANTLVNVSNSAGNIRAWHCTFVGEGASPTNTAITLTNTTAAHTLDIRNSIIQNYASMITPGSAVNTSNYNYISVADADAGANRITNTTLLTYDNTTLATPPYYKPTVLGAGELALVTANAALLGTDRFGNTRPSPVTTPDMGAVEDVSLTNVLDWAMID